MKRPTVKALLTRTWQWIEDRTGIGAAAGKLARHPVPPNVGWSYVFGSATLFIFVVQVITGVALSTAYVASSGQAHESLTYITEQAAFGNFLRGLHYFGASAMVVLIGLHTMRVFLTGAYKFPREANWLTGALLLLFTLGMGFTGQLLRWDQNAVWSVVVGAEQAGRLPLVGNEAARFILGGDTLGGATLSRFFAMHVFMFPAVIFLVVGFHLFLVIRNGISEPPVAGRPVDPATYRQQYDDMLRREGRPFWPHAAWRDVVVVMLIVAVLFLLAWLVGPPSTGSPPDPSTIQANPRPDWYLLWYFALLALLPPALEPWVIVLAPLVFFVGLFLIPLFFNKGERTAWRRPWSLVVVIAIVTTIGVLTIVGMRAPWSPDFGAQPLSDAVVGASSGPVRDGADLFHKKGCQYCHAVEGQGGLRGPDLTLVGDRLTDDQMRIRILNGRGNMPGFSGLLDADEVADLIAFLHSRTGE